MSELRMSLAAMLALVAVLALGPAAVSSAPGENAVVHWSGVAETAIAAGRPPASSTVLAAMVHGAMYDAVAAVEGGLEPFATGVKAPPDASADAAVAQAARDVLVARVPGQAANVQRRLRQLHGRDTGRAGEGPRDRGRRGRGGGNAGLADGRRFDDTVPYEQPTPGRACSSRSRRPRRST